MKAWQGVSNKPGRTVAARLFLLREEVVRYYMLYLMQCAPNKEA